MTVETNFNTVEVMKEAEQWLQDKCMLLTMLKLRNCRFNIGKLIEACEMLEKHPDDSEIQSVFCNALARVKGEIE